MQAMKAGADDFLAKPFDAEILWHLLNKAADSPPPPDRIGEGRLYRRSRTQTRSPAAPNRRFIDEYIVDSVSAPALHGEDLTVAYLDIDNFKLLNDFVGHEQGDHVLKRVVADLERTSGEPARLRPVRGR